MGAFFKTIKGRMKEMQSAQQGVLVKVEAMEGSVGSFESRFDGMQQDTQDLRNDDVELRRDLQVLDGLFKQMTRLVDSNKELIGNVEANAHEARNALSQRMDALKAAAKSAKTGAGAKVKTLQSKLKGQERQLQMKLENQEKLLLDQVRMSQQQEAEELRDAKHAIDRRFMELTGSLRAKEREIGALRKTGLSYERQIKRLELKVQEGEDKVGTIDKKVKKLHAKNILDKVLGLMKPDKKKPGEHKQQSPMARRMLEMAAAKSAERALAEVQQTNVGWQQDNSASDANAVLAAAAARRAADKATADANAAAEPATRQGMTQEQQLELTLKLESYDTALESMRKSYADLKVTVDHEMSGLEARHEAHLEQVRQDLSARHHEELEFQRQDWEERTESMRAEYESQLSRFTETHEKVQSQLNEAAAATAVLQAHKAEAADLLAQASAASGNNTAMSILGTDADSNGGGGGGGSGGARVGKHVSEALEEHTRHVERQHENIHRELSLVRRASAEASEEMRREIEAARALAVAEAKAAALSHADQHIRSMLNGFQDTAAASLNSPGSETRKRGRSHSPQRGGRGESPGSLSPTTAMVRANIDASDTAGTDGAKAATVGSLTTTDKLGTVILTSQKHQDHRIDVLLKKQMVAGREIGLLRAALLELESVVVKNVGAKVSRESKEATRMKALISTPPAGATRSGPSKKSSPRRAAAVVTAAEKAALMKTIETAVGRARRDIMGVATEANEAMKRVVAQTAHVETFVRKHQNEEKRLRAEQEYAHVKELQQMARLSSAHKMKALLTQQKQENDHQKRLSRLDEDMAAERAEFEKTKKVLLDELKQTRSEKETAQMLAKRMSERATAKRMQDAADNHVQRKGVGSRGSIGNFVGRGGNLRGYSREGFKDMQQHQKKSKTQQAEQQQQQPPLPPQQESAKTEDGPASEAALDHSLEVMAARTPNVLGYAASSTFGESTSADGTMQHRGGAGQSVPTTAATTAGNMGGTMELQTPGAVIKAAGLAVGQVPPQTSSTGMTDQETTGPGGWAAAPSAVGSEDSARQPGGATVSRTPR